MLYENMVVKQISRIIKSKLTHTRHTHSHPDVETKFGTKYIISHIESN